jgi:hypothetical protein
VRHQRRRRPVAGGGQAYGGIDGVGEKPPHELAVIGVVPADAVADVRASLIEDAAG